MNKVWDCFQFMGFEGQVVDVVQCQVRSLSRKGWRIVEFVLCVYFVEVVSE